MPGDVLGLLRIVWPFLAGAAALGLGCGLLAWSARPMGAAGRGALGLAGCALLAGFGAAILRAVPGRAGLALDLGLALFVSFAVAALVGSGLRRLFVVRRSADWS